MTTISQLKKQIGIEKAKIARAKRQEDLRMEQRGLASQLKKLKRSPSTKRSLRFLRRTGKATAKVAKIGGKFVVNQAKLIKEQQLRDEALDRQISISRKKSIKNAKRTAKKLKKARPTAANVLAPLDF